MTTYYARANLSAFTDVTGYSLTSGGPSAGAAPKATSDVLIFDANSGPSRTITGNLPYSSNYGINYIDMSAGNPMTMPDAVHSIGGQGQSANLTTTLKGSCKGIRAYIVANQHHSIDASACLVGSAGLSVLEAGYYYLIGSSFTTTGPISINGGSASDSYVYCTAGMTVTCNNISVTGSDSTDGWYGGFFGSSATLVVTGTGTCVNFAADAAEQVSSMTLVLTDTSSAVKTINLGNATLGSLVNSTGNGTSSGGLLLSSTSRNFGTVNCGKNGANTTFIGGLTYTASNWIIDGSGTQLNLTSSTTQAAILAKSVAGTIPANFCGFSYIAAAASPATAIRATNSKLGAGTSGVTLVGMTSRFMPFF